MKSTETLLSSFRDPYVSPRKTGKAVFCLSFLYLLAFHANAKYTPTILHPYDSARNSSPSEPPSPALTLEIPDNTTNRPVSEPIRLKDDFKAPKPTSETPTSNPTLLSLAPEPVPATKTPLPTPHTGVPEISDPTSTPPSDTSSSTPTPHAIASDTSHPPSTPPIPIQISEPSHSPKPEARNTTQKPNILDPSPVKSTHQSSKPTQSQSIKPTQATDTNFSTIMPTSESFSASPQARSHTEAPRTTSATSKPKIESLTPTITLGIKTEKPTSKPAGGLTNDPTPYPTFSPKPSLHPSAQPSYPLQISKIIRNLVMVFDDCEWLGPSSVDTWVSVTEKFIVSEIMRMADERNILYLDCNIFFRKQFIPAKNFNSNDTTRKRRHLQSSPLAIQFDQQFELRSSVQRHPYQKYFIETLDTAEKQSNYINELQNSGDPIFNSINTVKVTLGGRDISQPSSVTSIPKPSNIGPVTGIAVGIFFASVLTATLVILRRHNQYKSKVKKAFSTHGDSIYINVASNSPDVSTLSLPTGTFITQSMRFEDLTAGESTIKYDYEYKKYMPSAIMNQNLSDNPSMYIAQTEGNEPLGDEKVPSKETKPEHQDSGAITCDEGSFDDIFKSGSGSPEEMTQLPSEPVVPADVAMNVDSTTNTIYPYNERVLL